MESAQVPVLRVRDLSVGLKATGALLVDTVSFMLSARETLALVGGSGSGKSLTSLAIMGLLDPKVFFVSGRAELDGQDLLELPDAAVRSLRGNRIAMIFQEPMTSLNPVLTIGRQVAEALRPDRPRIAAPGARERVIELLDRVGISSAAKRIDGYPHQFSGGQRQRIVIAMALARNPRVLIADEPTTALDVTVQAQILDLLRELQSDHQMAVLFITHDMGVVAQIAHNVVVMRKGSVVESGPVLDVFERPSELYTKGLLQAVPHLGSMRGRDRPLGLPELNQKSCEIRPPADQAAAVDETVEPILRVRCLTKHYPVHGGLLGRVVSQVKAIEDITFDIRPGETLSLVGESGSGKSTTGRTIIRLQDPTSGDVVFEGSSLTGMRGRQLRSRRRHIQMIFQDPYSSLNPHMTVGAALAEPLVAHGLASRREAPQRVDRLLELVGLDSGAAKRLPREFSGGQRQRISIARALSLEPKLIIADEAVSALDAPVKAQIINLMISLQASLKLAFLFISHDMAVVERISHRVAVMKAGRIVEIGPRSAVFESPVHPYTQSLLAAVPIPDPKLRKESRSEGAQLCVKKMVLPSSSVLKEVAPGHFALIGD